MIAALVPGAEPLVGAYRDELDPTARRGLGAHLTLVYPFVEPAEVTDATVDALRAAVAAVPAFDCTFGELRWFGRRVLWLAPDAVGELREIAARVRAAFPALPAERPDAPEAALHAAEAALTPRLPLTVRIDRVALMVRAATWEVGAEAFLSPSGRSGRGSPGSAAASSG